MTIETLAVRPGDADYDRARTTFAGAAAPSLVLRPTSAEEVAACLAHARDEGLSLAIRSGGHNALGFGNIDGGAVLDLSGLDAVEALDGRLVRIGAGARWGAAARALAAHGLALTSGDTASVGVGGLTQAGGIGWMVRKHGLTIDNLVGAEVVTADGRIVRASGTENADLFWALRGGAGNFGVVTSFDFVAAEVATVHFGTITYALDDVAGMVRRWAAAMAAAPDELTSQLTFMPSFGDFPGGAVLHVCLAAPDTTALAPLRTIGTVVAEDVAERRYADVLEDVQPPPGILRVVDNALVESVEPALAEAIATAYAGGGRAVFLRSLGGAFGRVGPAETAFAHRGAQALVVSAAILPADATEDQVARAHAAWEPIGAHGVGCYAGFLGSDAPENVLSLWPYATLTRLREAKRTWDPENTFRRNFNIRPA